MHKNYYLINYSVYYYSAVNTFIEHYNGILSLAPFVESTARVPLKRLKTSYGDCFRYMSVLRAL